MSPIEARASTLSFSETSFVLNGKIVASPKGIVHNRTMYVPVWYLMRALAADGVTSTWAHGDWNMKTSARSIPGGALTVSGTGNAEVSLNGTLIQRTDSMIYADPASHVLTTYMPLWYVMQVLQRLNISSSWDGSTWRLFTHIPTDLMRAYQQSHPHNIVSFAQMVQVSSQGNQALLVENTASSTRGSLQPMILSVITPDLHVYNFQTRAQWTMGITQIPQKSMVAVTDGAGAHGLLMYMLKFVGGQPEWVQSFAGDNGVSAWLQDGTLMVEESNRTYNWNLTSPIGGKDDSAVTKVYQYNGESFQQTNEFVTGVFDNQTSLQTNPQVDAVNALSQLRDAMQSATLSHNLWTPSLFAEFAQQRSRLGFLSADNVSQVVSLTTVAANGQWADYLYQQGGDSLLLSLKNQPTWQVIGFTVNPSFHVLTQLGAGR